MTNPDAYTLAAQAAAARARAEAAQGQGTPGRPPLQSPMRKLSKIPVAHWLRTHWIGVAAAVAVLPLFGVVAAVRNSEAEYSATGKQGALWAHPSSFLPAWLGGHPAAANQPSLITDNQQYAALIHDYPDLALKPNDPPEIRGIKIGAINAHWKAKLEAEQDAATAIEKAKITAHTQAYINAAIIGPAQAQANVKAADEEAQKILKKYRRPERLSHSDANPEPPKAVPYSSEQIN